MRGKLCTLVIFIVLKFSLLSSPAVALHQCSPLISTPDYRTAIPCRDSDSEVRNQPLRYIVIHTTEGTTLDGAVHTLLEGGTSAHYVITHDGTVVQMVEENRVAFHAGNLDYNRQSIGIEHVARSTLVNLGLTPTQYVDLLKASAVLAEHLADKYGIPKTRLTRDQLVQADRQGRILSGIIAHADIPNKHPQAQAPHPNADAAAVSHFHHQHPSGTSCPGHWGGHSCHTDPGPYWGWLGWPCHLYTATPPPSSFPAGYGVPWNVFNPSELLIKAFCTDSSITAEVSPATYIYKWGYTWMGSRWRRINFTCTNGALVSNAWCPNSASANIRADATNYVAYTCQRINNEWKCGCRDSQCDQSDWQLQRIRR